MIEQREEHAPGTARIAMMDLPPIPETARAPAKEEHGEAQAHERHGGEQDGPDSPRHLDVSMAHGVLLEQGPAKERYAPKHAQTEQAANKRARHARGPSLRPVLPDHGQVGGDKDQHHHQEQDCKSPAEAQSSA